MTPPLFKSELRLIVQVSLPCEDILDGVAIYQTLKDMFVIYDPNVTMSGQLVKMLEPCCKERKESPAHDPVNILA